jgi:cytochrome b subunit of formate dehydrogenase
VNKIDIKNNTVQKYSIFTIFAHWILLISVLGLIFTGGFPLLNSALSLLVIDNLSIPELPYSTFIHNIFGFVLVFGIVFVIFTHSINLKDILSGKVIKDIGAFIRSFLYIIFLEDRLESGGSAKFYGYQKVTFILTIFALWMQIFSGLLLFFDPISGSNVSQVFMGSIQKIHLVGAILLVLLVLYHLIMAIRRLDKLSLKCIFYNGKIPLWYVKKNHRLWYENITVEKKRES